MTALSALPLGRYGGEQIVLSQAAGEAGVPFLNFLTTDEITAVLIAAGYVISTSMHAATVGSTFGLPVIVPGIEKPRTAFEACPVPSKVRGRG